MASKTTYVQLSYNNETGGIRKTFRNIMNDGTGVKHYFDSYGIPISADKERNTELSLLKSWSNCLTPSLANTIYDECVQHQFSFAGRGHRQTTDICWFYTPEHNLNIIDSHNFIQWQYTWFMNFQHNLFCLDDNKIFEVKYDRDEEAKKLVQRGCPSSIANLYKLATSDDDTWFCVPLCSTDPEADVGNNLALMLFGIMSSAQCIFFKRRRDAEKFVAKLEGSVPMCGWCELQFNKTKDDLVGEFVNTVAEKKLLDRPIDQVVSCFEETSHYCQFCAEKLVPHIYDAFRNMVQAELKAQAIAEELLKEKPTRKKSPSPPKATEECPLSANELKAIPPRPPAKLRSPAGSIIDNKKKQQEWDAKYSQYKKWLK